MAEPGLEPVLKQKPISFFYIVFSHYYCHIACVQIFLFHTVTLFESRVYIIQKYYFCKSDNHIQTTKTQCHSTFFNILDTGVPYDVQNKQLCIPLINSLSSHKCTHILYISVSIFIGTEDQKWDSWTAFLMLQPAKQLTKKEEVQQ